MKPFISTVCLSLGSLLAFGQAPDRTPRPGSELQVSYARETFKMHDLQASPVRYVANLNGARITYSRLGLRNRWNAGLQAGLADFIAPSLGIRGIKFAPDQREPLWLVPTVYRGRIELEYLRQIGRTAHRTAWLGLGLHDTFGYADGLALGTWVINTASAAVLYQTRLQLGRKHVLTADASLPVLAAVSRLPYSNVVSEPGRTRAATFFGNTRWTSLNRFLNPQVGLAYRFDLSRRTAFGAGYRFNWMQYPEPRPIRTATHSLNLSLVYKFQYQFR
ncbi:hypothetical protein [Larkinella soli]|uniref:hypothetical protein n=1 Tax=Larkinella soli TaxID=1770527 RepID=UPI000FFB1004|nr:hypothetical protein [Larkinella soli]